MTHLSELTLHTLPWDEPGFAADPYSHFEAARAVHPWLAKCPAGYVVFEYAAIKDLMWMDDKMRPSFDGIVQQMGAHGRPWGRFAEEQMIALPPREHKLMRETFAAKFTPRFANTLRPVMREIMTMLLDEWLPRGEFDFEELASYYPVSVLARLVGAPLEVIPALRSSMETMGLAFSMNVDMLDALDASFETMDAFAQGLMANRRANPRTGQEPDLLDILIEAADADGISQRQLADLLIFLFVAGYDTSKNVMTRMMKAMIENPEVYARCAEDLDYCRKAIEEMLRYFNPGTSFRFTDAEFEYRGVTLPKDVMLFFPLSTAGRDPTAWENPHAFDPDRPVDPGRRQVAFGLGKHMCLGQYIARAQLQEGLHLIAQRLQNPRHNGEHGWRPFPGVWGMKGLPIRFEAA